MKITCGSVTIYHMIAVVLRCGGYFLLDKIHSFGSYLFGGTIDRLGRGAPGSGTIGSFTVSDSVIFPAVPACCRSGEACSGEGAATVPSSVSDGLTGGSGGVR